MTEKNKNNKKELSDFLRYLRNEMTGKERNSFERELEKDPFAYEATEGLSQISGDDATKDLTHMKTELKKKTGKKSAALYYSIAASLAIIVAISSIIYFTHTGKPDYTISENIRPEKEASEPSSPADITDTPAGRKESEMNTPEKGKVGSQQSLVQENTEDKTEFETDKELDNKYRETAEDDTKEQMPIAIQTTADIKPEDNVEDIAMISEQAETLRSPPERKMAMAAGAPEAAKARRLSEHTSARPSVGTDSFNLYLEKNIRNLEPEITENLVVISFTVNTDSTLSPVTVISSPGHNYTIEAIRLIKEGPAWYPAIVNGKAVEEEVRLTVRFR
jgi:hypothetical protein